MNITIIKNFVKGIDANVWLLGNDELKYIEEIKQEILLNLKHQK